MGVHRANPACACAAIASVAVEEADCREARAVVEGGQAGQRGVRRALAGAMRRSLNRMARDKSQDNPASACGGWGQPRRERAAFGLNAYSGPKAPPFQSKAATESEREPPPGWPAEGGHRHQQLTNRRSFRLNVSRRGEAAVQGCGSKVRNRPRPACRVAPKRPDGEPSLFLVRFYEAAARDLTHPAICRRWRLAASRLHIGRPAAPPTKGCETDEATPQDCAPIAGCHFGSPLRNRLPTTAAPTSARTWRAQVRPTELLQKSTASGVVTQEIPRNIVKQQKSLSL